MELIEIEEKKGVGPHIVHVPAKQYHSVEFSVDGSYFVHQFKIRYLTKSSIGILARENSEIIGLLKIGDIVNMKYYPEESFLPPEMVDTEIQYITKENQGRFQGHYLIGLDLFDQAPQEHIN